MQNQHTDTLNATVIAKISTKINNC